MTCNMNMDRKGNLRNIEKGTDFPQIYLICGNIGTVFLNGRGLYSCEHVVNVLDIEHNEQ